MKTIFVPTDLSKHALEALRYALHLSKAVHAEKLVFYHNHVVPLSSEVPVIYTDSLTDILKSVKEEMAEQLERCMADAGLPSHFLTTESLVTSELSGGVQAIIHQAHTHKADLIVMGTHGRTGLEKLIFGSVTSGVMESSTIPVLAIPPHYRYKPVDKLAFASSLTYFTHEVKSVLSFADQLFAELEVIHIDYGLLSAQLINHAKRVLDKLDHTRLKLKIIPAVQADPLKDNLLRYLEKEGPEWLVMFTTPRDWYQKIILSSKTLELAASYRKPMLVIRKKED